jgi:hypothetical protein
MFLKYNRIDRRKEVFMKISVKVIIFFIVVGRLFSDDIGNEKKVIELIKLNGYEKNILDISSFFKNSIEKEFISIDKNSTNKILEELDIYFKFDKIKNEIINYIIDNYVEKSIDYCLDFYKTELYTKIKQLEENIVVTEESINKIDFNKLSQRRSSLIEKLINDKTIYLNYIEIYQEEYESLYVVANRKLGKEYTNNVEKIKKDIEIFFSSNSYISFLRKTLIITYLSISDDELETYLLFLLSDEAKWVNNKLNEGFAESLKNCRNNFIESNT